MSKRLNQQAPYLKLKDSIKKENARIYKNTLPLNCYGETADKIIKTCNYHIDNNSLFSLEDVKKYSENKRYQIVQSCIDNVDEIILSPEQEIVKYFEQYYNLENEIHYKLLQCSELDKTQKDVSNLIQNIGKSLLWCEEELSHLYKKDVSNGINNDKKKINKILNEIQKHNRILCEYSPFWNKSILDLVNLYSIYSNNNPMESIIHSLVILSSLIKKQDIKAFIDEKIKILYQQNIDNLDLNILKTLYECSITVKMLIKAEIGDTKEFVIDKIRSNNTLKKIFFVESESMSKF